MLMTTYTRELLQSTFTETPPALPPERPGHTDFEVLRERGLLANFLSQIIVTQGDIEKKLFWTGTSASSISVPQADKQYLDLLEILQCIYLFRGERAYILHFLEKNPFLVPLLVEAYFNILEFFPHSLVYLMITTNVEDPEPDRLVVSIATSLEPGKAIDALNAFDKKWWLKSLKRAQGKLCILLEFQ